MKNMISVILSKHQAVLNEVIEHLQDDILKASSMFVDTIQAGNKIMLCGNGGSAADAQHIAAEISGRFVKDRKGLAGLALSTDTSVLTSVSNDFGFESVFSRQVEALAHPGDLLVGISTSGNSPNVLAALKMARQLQCKTLGLSGNEGGKFSGFCDLNLVVPSSETARIQEMHILIGHILCQAIDDYVK
jgi:D-sedoheptulose 7-phosphate isomerase